MRSIASALFMALIAISIATFAAESTQQNAIEGTWTLTKSVNGIIIDERSSQKLSRTPGGVGFVYLDDGEFKVPGESAGSKRSTVPRGFHFRIEPKAIDESGAVVDVLQSYTELKSESEGGFVIEKRQVDGRYEMKFDAPYSLILSLPDVKTAYTLTVKLRRAK